VREQYRRMVHTERETAIRAEPLPSGGCDARRLWPVYPRLRRRIRSALLGVKLDGNALDGRVGQKAPSPASFRNVPDSQALRPAGRKSGRALPGPAPQLRLVAQVAYARTTVQEGHGQTGSEERVPLTDAESAPLMAAYRSTITLSDLTNVVAAAHEIQQSFRRDAAWWRGHAKVEWRLEAQVHRQDPEHPERRLYDEPALIGHFSSARHRGRIDHARRPMIFSAGFF
jgi:hypothetical protein